MSRQLTITALEAKILELRAIRARMLELASPGGGVTPRVEGLVGEATADEIAIVRAILEEGPL